MINWSELKFRPNNKAPKVQGFDTLIAAGALLTGDLQIADGVSVLDCNFTGNQINAGSAVKPETMLVLGTKSVVKAKCIDVPILVANGNLNVDVIAVDTLSLGPNADVTARTIRYRNLVMAAGSVLSGELRNNLHTADDKPA